jgi:hypothetical protein
MACVKLVDYVRAKNDLELIQTEIDELELLQVAPVSEQR